MTNKGIEKAEKLIAKLKETNEDLNEKKAKLEVQIEQNEKEIAENEEIIKNEKMRLMYDEMVKNGTTFEEMFSFLAKQNGGDSSNKETKKEDKKPAEDTEKEDNPAE